MRITAHSSDRSAVYLDKNFVQIKMPLREFVATVLYVATSGCHFTLDFTYSSICRVVSGLVSIQGR